MANCLDKISLAGGHLLMLVNDILDMSKVESGKMAITASVFSLEKMISRMVNIVQPQIKAKSQVFINILTNAIKYTPEGGRIALFLSEGEGPVEGTAHQCKQGAGIHR